MSGIDPRLDDVLERLSRIEAKQDALLAKSAEGNSGGAVASDEDLEGEYGDPKVWIEKVKGWEENMAGKKYSECPPEFLDLMATALDNVAASQKRKGNARYWTNNKDAAKARAHAIRLRRNA